MVSRHKNAYDLQRLKEESDRLLEIAEAAARQAEEAQRQQEKEERFKAESKQKTEAYIKLRALEQIERGEVNPKVIRAYLENEYPNSPRLYDLEYQKVVHKLLTHPLNGLSKTADGYQFLNSKFASVDKLRDGVERLLGEQKESSYRWLTMMVEDLVSGRHTEWSNRYYEGMLPLPEAPEDVTFEDYFYLGQLGLAPEFLAE